MARRIKWFATLKEARKYNKEHPQFGFHVYKWTFTKRAKPYFVGDELEWLNV